MSLGAGACAGAGAGACGRRAVVDTAAVQCRPLAKANQPYPGPPPVRCITSTGMRVCVQGFVRFAAGQRHMIIELTA